MTKIEDAMDAALNFATGVHVMEWGDRVELWGHLVVVHGLANHPVVWSPADTLTDAFQVDKPEWEWRVDELGDWYGAKPGWRLRLGIWDDDDRLTDITIPLDPDNKTLAYCRGRCIAALKACGIEEV